MERYNKNSPRVVQIDATMYLCELNILKNLHISQGFMNRLHKHTKMNKGEGLEGVFGVSKPCRGQIGTNDRK